MNKTARNNIALALVGIAIGYGYMSVSDDDFRQFVASERHSCEMAQQGYWPESEAWDCAGRHGIAVNTAEFEAREGATMERNRLLNCVAAYHDRTNMEGFGCASIWAEMAEEMGAARDEDVAMGGQAKAYWR